MVRYRDSWSRILGAAAVALACGSSGCAGTGAYVWYRDYRQDPSQAGDEYLIGTGDMISIKVLGHDEMSVHQRVRPDGRLSLLLIGEVEVKGKRPSSLKAELEARLKDYIVSPSVSVNIEEVPPLTVSILGEVQRPGSYPMELDPSLAHAFALCGGLTDYASRNAVYVVRRDPRPMRIRFSYDEITRNSGGAGAFALRRGDVIEVE